MKRLILIFLLLSLFSGCGIFGSNCENYCEGNILHECEQSQGGIGWSDNWYEWDCSKEGKICSSIYSYSRCHYDPERCEEGVQSFCIDNKIINCSSKNEKFYANLGEECLAIEVCVELSDNAKCVIPVEECDPSENEFCINNKIAVCYEIDGSFYAYSKHDCGDDYGCAEKGNNEVECLIQVDICDPDAESVCYYATISECFMYDGNYFIDIISQCYSQKCVYDPETMSAECI